MMQQPLLRVYALITIVCAVADALQLPTRREAVISVSGALGIGLPVVSAQAQMEAETVDISAFNAAKGKSSGNAATVAIRSGKIRSSIIPSLDPSPLLPIRGGRKGKSTIQIPYIYFLTPV